MRSLMSPLLRASVGIRAAKYVLTLVLLALFCSGCGQSEGMAHARQDSRASSVEVASGEARIVAMCAENYAVEVCRCAMPAFEQAVGAEAAVYEAISAQLLEKRAEGMDYIPAWEAAVEAVAVGQGVSALSLQARMNPVGVAHNRALAACEW